MIEDKTPVIASEAQTKTAKETYDKKLKNFLMQKSFLKRKRKQQG